MGKQPFKENYLRFYCENCGGIFDTEKKEKKCPMCRDKLIKWEKWLVQEQKRMDKLKREEQEKRK